MVGGGGETETHCAIKYSDRSRTRVCVHTFVVYVIISMVARAAVCLRGS